MYVTAVFTRMCAAGVRLGDDEKLTSRYVGRVSHGSQQERVLLETAGSIEGSLSVSIVTIFVSVTSF